MSQSIIVGGGPAGSILALQLARRGREVLILEQANFPREKTCGEFISPLGVHTLRRIGLLKGALDLGARWIDHARITLPQGRDVTAPFAPLDHASYREQSRDTATEQRGLTLPRRELDALCLHAAEAAGAEVRQGFRVHDLSRWEGGMWRIMGRNLNRSSGNPELVEGDLLVGADGVGSVVARRLGWLRRAWPRRMGITASFIGLECDPGVIEMHLLSNAYCGVVGQTEGNAHVGLAFPHRKGEWPRGKSTEEIFFEHLERFPGIRDRLKGAALQAPVKAFGPMSVRSLRQYGEGVLLVGDAASFLDPITGHGIGFALRSAELAADVLLSQVSSTDYSSQRLKAYGAAYRREFGPMLRLYEGVQRLLALPRPALNLLSIAIEKNPPILRWAIPQLMGTSDPGILEREEPGDRFRVRALLSPPPGRNTR